VELQELIDAGIDGFAPVIIRSKQHSADNPDEYGEIIEENFAISYPEKFLFEKFPGLYP
jgi:hypothetical protein